MTKYTIEAHKRFFADPVDMWPTCKDHRTIVVEAANEEEAMKIAELQYGSCQRTGKDGRYVRNTDGSWTLMEVVKTAAQDHLEAMRFSLISSGSKIAEWCGGTNENSPDEIQIQTNKGVKTAMVGDYIVKINGEFHPCKLVTP